MQFKLVKEEGLSKHFNVQIPAQEITNDFDKEINDLASKIKMPGFRPGKVPLDHIKKLYGKSIKADIVNKLVSRSVDDLIKNEEYKLELATQPTIDNFVNEDDKDISFDFICETLPKIDLPNFKEITLEQYVPIISSENIEDAKLKFKKLNTKYETAKSKTKKVEDNDMVIIDFEGFIDGNSFKGGKAEGHSLVIGSKSFIEGFESQLIGAKLNEQRTVNVTFPSNYPSEQAGKLAEFVVIIKEIKTPIVPELDEKFLADMKIESLSVLEDNLKIQLMKGYESSLKTIMKIKLFDQLDQMLDFNLPQSMVDNEFNILWENVKRIGESDPSIVDQDEETLKQYYRKVAQRRVKIGLMLSHYAKEKSVRITNEELQKVIINESIRNFADYNKGFEYFRKNPAAIESLKGPMLEEKAVDKILSDEINLTIIEKPTIELDKIIEEENNIELEKISK